ncbi:replication initiation factor domain-containing protein [Escherichia coli]|uniref:replication initiation factor domain-containing protein n=2 Tax=Escherichia coli TaxID=562 RepID=UPI00128F7921|nr:replication initiation factor domain-containing protein [Escherichia coli]MQL46362.1 hypothetical protein [Escherichia coli]
MTHKKITYAISKDGSRSMIVGTGYAAHDAAQLLFSINPETLSIARADVQETIAVANPDATIQFLVPRKAYQATRVSAVNSEGETLYVGAPSSRARLRVYNKTAESGLVVDGSKLLRVEVQLRDSYADQAYQQWRFGKLDALMVTWIERMLEPGSAKDLKALCATLNVDRLQLVEPEDEEWAERRKVWFETCVVPAMLKLLAVEPDYAEVVRRKLLDR